MTTKDQAIAQLRNPMRCDYPPSGVFRLMDVVAELLEKPPAPDCRTCEQYREADGICEYPLNHGLKQCTNGDQYKPAPKVVLWKESTNVS